MGMRKEKEEEEDLSLDVGIRLVADGEEATMTVMIALPFGVVVEAGEDVVVDSNREDVFNSRVATIKVAGVGTSSNRVTRCNTNRVHTIMTKIAEEVNVLAVRAKTCLMIGKDTETEMVLPSESANGDMVVEEDIMVMTVVVEDGVDVVVAGTMVVVALHLFAAALGVAAVVVTVEGEEAIILPEDEEEAAMAEEVDIKNSLVLDSIVSWMASQYHIILNKQLHLVCL
mmetsp:Transcript_23999/g.33693  ORF Transcript_23999/g.33693 Transcript_23999/m.33693 type:complete len:228 (+) Transcript_23999:1710-2393(+)